MLVGAKSGRTCSRRADFFLTSARPHNYADAGSENLSHGTAKQITTQP
jgi:hypothetical protein